MSQKNREELAISRRKMLSILAASCLASLLACDPGGGTQEGSRKESVADGGQDGGSPEDGGADATPAASWAKGGTQAMTARASYPDPFAAAATACMLIATTTEGPCTTGTELERQDISEGHVGLPVRLGIRVVDSSCKPLSGALVRVWHTNAEGSYSGQTPHNDVCLKNPSYTSTDFFRGVQTTSADGIVYFDTCFPGWYRGRAVHIHFQIGLGGQSTRVSQLFFPEDTTKEIFAEHSEYSSFGQPDTVFSNDLITKGIPSSERERHIMSVQRMSDGAMLASKTVTVV